MQKSETTVSKETPKTRTPKSGPKKKSSPQKALKWFKGTPKSRSSQKMSKKLLKSPPVEKTPQKPPTPPGVVDFDFDGSSDRVSIYDLLPCTEIGENLSHDICSSDTPVCAGDSVHSSEASLSTNKTVTSDNAKDSPKGRAVPKKDIVQKKNKLPVNRNLNKSLCDPDGRKKSPPLCKLPEACFDKLKDHKISEAPPLPIGYIRYMEIPQEELADEVEYDLDGEDFAWLSMVNEKRKCQNLHPVKFADMELLMDRLEKESYFQMQSTGIDQGALIDDDAVCCICMDGECQNSNAILFCDMCNLAVHQECYGVPYIPEGQWLCRRCLQSPSRAVDCALCPNKGGAFKQTDDGRWAHVVCAIWIPEVCFANTVFLEPVDSIGNIPPARWRLVCFICKQKGVGACIQCHKSNCYIAFHVTCAQQAGLCMKMDTVRESSSITVKKTAYCDNHAPPDSDFVKDGEGSPSPRQKMRQARKLLAEKRSAVPVLSIPTIPDERVAEIAQTVSFARKSQFIKRLMAYWKLKRQSRNGVPLLRRLQAASALPHPPARDASGGTGSTRSEESQAYYRYWLRLRQDLERARLLCELVRKREKVKKELIHLKCRELDIRLRPFSMFLLNVLDEIQAWDVQEIFAKPVDVSEVPDYLTIVKHPMDLQTMRDKINSFEYNNIDAFEEDFNLMIDNCLNYNSKDTIFYRQGIKLREQGGIIIRHARRSIDAIGFDPTTGLHLPERKHVPVVLTDEQIVQKVEGFLSDARRFELPFDKHLEMLNEVLDDTLALTHPATRKKKFTKVKHEIVRVRRMKHSKLNKLSSKSPLKDKYKKKENLVTDSETDELQDLATKSKHRARLRLYDDKTSSAADVSESTTTKRSLRPSKRKRDPTPPPPLRDVSPSPPVLRGSKARDRAKIPSLSSSSSSSKKARRASSSGASAESMSTLSTPSKGRKKVLGGSLSEERQAEKKNVTSTSPTPPQQTPNKISNSLRDRDSLRLRDRESVDKSSSSSPTKTPTKLQQQTGVNRRNTVLLTKKINATLQDSPSPVSSPAKSLVPTTPPPKVPTRKLGSTPKKLLSPLVTTTTTTNATTQQNSIVKSDKNPPRRNSARIRNFTNNNNNNVNINNNVISNVVPWPHVDGFPNNNNSFGSGDGMSPNVTPPWNNSSSSVAEPTNHFDKTHFKSNDVAYVNNSTNKRRKKGSSPVAAGYNSKAVNVIPVDASLRSVVSGGGSVMNNGLSTPHHASPRVGAVNNSTRSHVKSDSFSVYRSGKDLDLNSEDEEEEEEEDKEDDDEANQNSDNGSSDNDESIDGSQDSGSGDESSSECSKSNKSSSSSSSSSDSESSYQSSSRRGYDTRRPRHNENNSVNHKHGHRTANRRKDNNDGDDEEHEDEVAEEEEEEEEGLITDRSHVRMSMKYALQPLDLVWAKCKEGSWYPALIIDPDMPLGFTQNDIQIPGPPVEILSKRPRSSAENYFLVLCFDTKRTWEWIVRNHLEPLGLDPKRDREHLMTRKTDKRTLGALRKAYEKALLHRNRLNGTSDNRVHGFPN